MKTYLPLLFLCALCLFTCDSFAQSQLELYLGYRYEADQTLLSTPTSFDFNTSRIEGNLRITDRFRQTNNNEFVIQPKYNLTFGATQRFNLGDRIQLGLGGRLIIKSFKYDRMSNVLASEFLSSDTTVMADPPPTPPIICDQFIIEGERFLDFEPDNQVVYLRIPIGLSFDASRTGRVRIGANLFFQTPIAATTEVVQTDFSSETVNGQVICTSSSEVEDQQAGDLYRLSQFGLSGNLAYEVLPGIRLELSIEKLMSNAVFLENDDMLFFTPSGLSGIEYKPLIYQASVSYQFGSPRIRDSENPVNF